MEDAIERKREMSLTPLVSFGLASDPFGLASTCRKQRSIPRGRRMILSGKQQHDRQTLRAAPQSTQMISRHLRASRWMRW